MQCIRCYKYMKERGEKIKADKNKIVFLNQLINVLNFFKKEMLNCQTNPN